MLRGMTASKKIAISLPAPLVAKANRAVKEGYAKSVSAYIARAVEEKANGEDLRQMLAEMLAETGGPTTDDEHRRLDAAFRLRPGETLDLRSLNKKKAKKRRAA
jgi:Arc/MetJ-type ribon-helix-helix transcriptional regulator